MAEGPPADSYATYWLRTEEMTAVRVSADQIAAIGDSTLRGILQKQLADEQIGSQYLLVPIAYEDHTFSHCWRVPKKPLEL